MNTENTLEKDRLVLFYILRHPVSLEIRYLGKTVNSLQKRLNRHRTSLKGHVGKWVHSLKDQGLIPDIIEIGRCYESEDWGAIEKLLIKEYRLYGYRLCNLCDGGIGGSGFKRTPEQVKTIIKNNSIPVFSFEISTKKVKKFTSLKTAASFLDVSPSLISMAISKKGSVKGFILSKSMEFKQSKVSSSYRKQVLCYNSRREIVFQSAREAERILRINSSLIRKVCQGIYQQCGGYKFEYYNKH